jgi:hypothetical protein
LRYVQFNAGTQSRMTMPAAQEWKIRRRALRWPVISLVVTVLLAWWTKNAEWFGPGGAVISAIGARLWAERVFRLGARSDDPLPPLVLQEYVAAGAVPLNSDHFNESLMRLVDNVKGLLGVWVSIVGGIIAAVVPFACKNMHWWTPVP